MRIAILFLVAISLAGCGQMVRDVHAKNRISEYLKDLSIDDYSHAYQLLSSEMKVRMAIEDFIRNDEKADVTYGEIKSYKIGKLELVDPYDRIYDVKVVTEKAKLDYKIEVIQVKDKWYIRDVKLVAEEILGG